MGKTATIRDVAKLAGVSTATVSHTINQTRYVSEETRERVIRIAADDVQAFLNGEGLNVVNP